MMLVEFQPLGGMAFKFENLKVWQKSIELASEISLLTKKFPKDELYVLTAQTKRAADSVALNIAEGSTGPSSIGSWATR